VLYAVFGSTDSIETIYQTLALSLVEKLLVFVLSITVALLASGMFLLISSGLTPVRVAH
jgi:hypothetical protein